KGGVKDLSEIQKVIIQEIKINPDITTKELAQKTGIKFRTLQRYIAQLQALGNIYREGGRKKGRWVIVSNA
ncbi:MAG: HTH domain-containing protein, partial [Bacteroidales bacterium]|nr:HTH domain-containing protein [Bacteroidales bacterium]